MTFDEWYLNKYGASFDSMFYIEGMAWDDILKGLCFHMREYVSQMIMEE